MNLSSHLRSLKYGVSTAPWKQCLASGTNYPRIQSSFLIHQAQEFHSSNRWNRKSKKELSSEPTRFSSSPANVQSMPDIPEKNAYQPLIVAVSMTAFILYFFLFREENDLDEQLNVGLFERIPALEEPHLAQAIPRMKARGEDTTEAEARLKELIAMRKAAEKGSS